MKLDSAEIVGVCACNVGTHRYNEKCLNCQEILDKHSGGRCSNLSRDLFQCKKVHLLRVCKKPGMFKTKFAIANESDRKDLKNFLNFMSG